MHCFHCNSKLYTGRVQHKLYFVYELYSSVEIFYRTVAHSVSSQPSENVITLFSVPYSNCVYTLCLDNITNMIIIRNWKRQQKYVRKQFAFCTQIQSAFASNCYKSSQQQKRGNAFNMNWKCQNSRKFCKLLDTIADTRRCFHSSEMNMEKNNKVKRHWLTIAHGIGENES